MKRRNPRPLNLSSTKFYDFYYNTKKNTRSIQRLYIKFIYFSISFSFIAGPVKVILNFIMKFFILKMYNILKFNNALICLPYYS